MKKHGRNICLWLILFVATYCSGEGIVTLTPKRILPNSDCLNIDCPNRQVIVFIHGVFGAEDTWGQSPQSWPDLLLGDPRFREYDIYLASYPTSMEFWSPGNKIRLTQVAEDFSRRLEELAHYGNVYIIAHSMGGNIVTTSMIMLKLRRPNAHVLLSKVRTTILLGSPIDGADISGLGEFLSQDQKLIALKPAAENELPVLVEMGIKSIDQKRTFLEMPPLSIWAGYELDKIGPRVIVTRESATKISNRVCGFHKNHLSLVKPKTTDDPVYKWTSDIILKNQATCPPTQ